MHQDFPLFALALPSSANIRTAQGLLSPSPALNSPPFVPLQTSPHLYYNSPLLLTLEPSIFSSTPLFCLHQNSPPLAPGLLFSPDIRTPLPLHRLPKLTLNLKFSVWSVVLLCG